MENVFASIERIYIASKPTAIAVKNELMIKDNSLCLNRLTPHSLSRDFIFAYCFKGAATGTWISNTMSVIQSAAIKKGVILRDKPAKHLREIRYFVQAI